MRQLELGYDAKGDTQHHVEHLLNTVITWCRDEAPNWFDDSMVHSFYIQFHESVKPLTDRQVAALENIARKFNIK